MATLFCRAAQDTLPFLKETQTLFPQLYLKLCVQSWSFLAQAMPASGVPAAAATTAPAAPLTTAPMPAATTAPVTTLPVPAASGAPALPVQLPIEAGANPQIDLNMPPPAHGPVHDWMHGLFLLVYFLICIGLIGCVLFQTTKNEGLSGVIGGQVSSSLFRGKKSAEESLTSWTNWLAVAFIVCSMLIWLLFGRGA